MIYLPTNKTIGGVVLPINYQTCSAAYDPVSCPPGIKLFEKVFSNHKGGRFAYFFLSLFPIYSTVVQGGFLDFVLQVFFVPIFICKNFGVPRQPYLPQCGSSNQASITLSRDDCFPKQTLRQGERLVHPLSSTRVFHPVNNTETKFPGPSYLAFIKLVQKRFRS